MMEKIVQTAKQTVKATVLAVNARVEWEVLIVVTFYGSVDRRVILKAVCRGEFIRPWAAEANPSFNF